MRVYLSLYIEREIEREIDRERGTCVIRIEY